MWYDIKYEESIRFIKNCNRVILEKEYRDIAKNLKLLSPTSLRYITGLNFNELVKKVRLDMLVKMK